MKEMTDCEIAIKYAERSAYQDVLLHIKEQLLVYRPDIVDKVMPLASDLTTFLVEKIKE